MNEFRFERPEMLWLLLLAPPALIAFLVWAWRKRQRLLGEFIEPRLLVSLTAGVSPARRKLRYALLVGAVVALIFTLAQPQWGFDWEETKQRGLDIVVAIDTSKSMLAEDIAPNRLARAKLATQDLMQLAHSDRLGLVGFAGVAFLICPLTVDDSAFKQCLDTLDVTTLPQGGTAIAGAIEAALTAFKDDPENHKILVLFSDGDDHDEGAVEAAQKAAEKGLRIFTIGIGSPEGELIRVKQPNGSTDFIRDTDGNVVKSRLNEALLREIATSGRGFYLPLRGAKTIDTLYESGLAPLPKTDSATRLVKRYHQQFFWPLALALLCLLAEIIIPERRRVAKVLLRSAAPGTPVAPAVAALLLCGALAADASSSKALRDYEAGRYDEALKEFKQLHEKKSGDARLPYNAGAAAYRDLQYEEAAKLFGQTLAAPDLKLQQRGYYNRGNTLFQLGERETTPDKRKEAWEKSLKDFESSLKLDPQDSDAKFNQEFVKRQLEELKQQQQQQNKDDKNDKQDKDQKQQDQQNQQNQDQKDQKEQQQQKPDQQKQNQQDQQQAQSKQDQQKQAEQQKEAQQAQAQKKKDEEKKQAQAAAQQDKKESPDKEAEEDAKVEPGQMTPQQARQILDAQKSDENMLPLDVPAKPHDSSRPFKDW